MGFFCKVFASLVLLFRGIFRLGSILLLSTIFLFGSIFLLSVAAFDPVHCIPNNPFCSPPGARPTGFVGEISASGNASIDWKETWAAHVFKVDLPELNKGEVKVEVEQGRILRIRGVRCKEEEKIDKRYCVAWSERFLRRYRLPVNANVDEASAVYKNGVLTVTVPKEKPVVKSIKIS